MSRPTTPQRPEPVMPEVLRSFEVAARTRRRSPWRRRLRVGGAGLAIVLVSGSALAATGQWNPFGTGPGDAYTLAPPVPDQASEFAVLRRPQADRDRGALISAFLLRMADGPQGRILLRSVRYLRDVDSRPTVLHNGRADVRRLRAELYLVPVQQRGSGSRATVPSSGQGGLPAIPGSMCLWSVADGWPVGGPAPFTPPGATSPPRPPALADRVTGGGTCGSPHTIRTKGLMMGAANDGSIVGIVPDGVAFVRQRTRDGGTVTARVRNNSFELLAPGRDLGPDPAVNGPGRPDLPPLSGQFKHGTQQWLAGDGRVLRRLPQ